MWWFLNLAGWPIFLAIVVFLFVFGLGLSVLMTWLANRSVAQNAVLAVVGAAAIMGALIGTLARATHHAFGR